MKDKEKGAIDLIVVDPSAEHAEIFANLLRDLGMVVHHHSADDEGTLLPLLTADVDLIVQNADDSRLAPARLAQLLREARCDAALIAVAAEPDSDFKAEALRAGYDDVVTDGDLEQLRIALRRERAHLRIRRQLQQERLRVREMEQRCTSLIANSRDAVCYLQDGVFVQINASFLALFGLHGADEIIGLPLLDLVALEEQDRVKPRLRAVMLGQKEDDHLTTRCLQRDGSPFDAYLEFSRFHLEGEPAIQLRIQKREKPATQPLLNSEAHRDAETGLFNRQYLLQQVEKRVELAETAAEGEALVLIEVDAFREIRRKIGIRASERLLKEITGTLLQVSRPEELLARFGDSSFALVAERPDALALGDLAERICTAVGEMEFQAGFERIRPSCSVGVTILKKARQHHHSPVDLAIAAVERAAEAGGGQFVFDNGEAGGDGELIPTSLIHAALEEDRFRLHFQPVVNLQENTSEDFLVMLRLLDLQDNEIPAATFLKQVESAGLMDAIDRWVIEHAIRSLKNLHRQGHRRRYFITLSSASINDGDLPIWINERLCEHELPAEYIIFQLHERDVRSLFEKATRLVEDLKHIGCRIAIDRFGLYPDGRRLVYHLGADYVRLDPSFMQQLAEDEDKQERLARIAEQLQEMEIQMIAASVEDARSLSVLWKLGIDHIQGHFLQPPSPRPDYEFQNG